MPDKKPAETGMGDLIASTRQRLEQPADPADRLKSLMATTTTPAPTPRSSPPRDQAPALTNYHPQIPSEAGVIPKRLPQRGPKRAFHISMRLSAPERDRLVRWCDARNLSLADGLSLLLDLAEARGGDPE